MIERYVLPPTEVHTLYSLTTFYVSCLGFFQTIIFTYWDGEGSLEGVFRRVQKIIKKFADGSQTGIAGSWTSPKVCYP